MKIFTGIVMTLLVAAAAWGVIAGIAVLALHAKQQSERQAECVQAWPLPPPCGTAIPVWNPAKQEWVTP